MSKKLKKIIFKKPVIILLLFVFASSFLMAMPDIGKTSNENNVFKQEQKKIIKENYLAGEQAQKNGWNYTSFPIEFDTTTGRPSKFQAEFHVKWINYKTETGWLPINTDFIETKNGFEMMNAPFTVVAPLTSTGIAVMHNNNKWDVFNNKEIDEPALDMSIEAQGVNEARGKIVRGDLMTPTGLQENINYVIYEGAYLEGDLIYYVDFGKAPRLEKLIKFNSEPTVKEYSFNISYSGDVDFKLNNNEKSWDKLQTLNLSKGKKLNIGKRESSLRGMGFKQFQIWDSNLNYLEDSSLKRNISNIEVKIKPNGKNSYILTKILPDNFFTNSLVYPVYTDTTSTFYPDPDTETNSVDGDFQTDSGVRSWENTESITTASDTSDNGTHLFCGGFRTYSGLGHCFLERSVLLFDTSSLPDSVITMATLSIYGMSKADVPSNNPSLNIYTSNPASNTSLTNSDLGTVGSAALSTSINYSSWTISGYNDFVLNTAGINNISDTGITKFGTRESVYDGGTSTPGWATTGDTFIRGYSADQSGTSQDPKLVVVYVFVPSVPASLKVEGQTNPTKVTDTFPEFYATYEDDDTGDNAIYYQIQVATSSSYWGDPIWDSSKTAMATTTEGSICPSVTYGDSDGLAFDGATYYWRMKFWDDEDNEGDWSDGNDYFIMADSVRLQFP